MASKPYSAFWILTIMFVAFAISCEKRSSESINNSQAGVHSSSDTTSTVQAEPTTTVVVNNTPTVGLEIGDIAPDLNLKDTSETEVRLSDLRHGYVLLEFWASWCRPCKMENKNLVSIYESYRDTSYHVGNGLEIYMVSVFEHKKEHWLNELRKQQYNWRYNVYDEGGSAALLYNVKAVPTNFLIDPTGIIIARDLRGPLVEKALIQLLK